MRLSPSSATPRRDGTWIGYHRSGDARVAILSGQGHAATMMAPGLVVDEIAGSWPATQ